MRLDMDRLREIVKLLKDESLSEITIADGESRVTVRQAFAREARPAGPLSAAGGLGAASAVPPEAIVITAPLVGTFYRRATPDSDPFVGPGQTVRPGDTVCVIEAMKVMNEIKAEVAGRVRSVLAEDGAPVEYGQVLFVLDPV